MTERNGGGCEKKTRHRWGSGGRLDANVPQIGSVHSDVDPVVSVGVSKVCTRTLVSIEYGAKILTRNLASCRLLLLAEVEQQRTRPNELVGADDGGSVAVAAGAGMAGLHHAMVDLPKRSSHRRRCPVPINPLASVASPRA